MRVLVACEFSGIVREAFRRRGHDAWSCDLLPAEDRSLFHIQDDAAVVARAEDWRLMVAHPPCTYMTNSGVRWFYDADKKPILERFLSAEHSYRFFNSLASAPIGHIALENPIPHRFARQAVGRYTQIVQPWMFGHGETKATCLWLKNLPPLVPTNLVEGRDNRVHREPPSPERWKNRSRTLQGIADAMAEQWGALDQERSAA